MGVQAIRELIDKTKKAESESGHLQKQIFEQMENLHHSIELPEENATETIIRFVVEYIDHVPEFLDALYKASHEAGISSFINPFLDIAAENFLSSISRDDLLTGQDILLDKAYFAHRLIEEVNEQYLLKTGCTLIPMNMTWSNLIIHSIMGESFGNELDKIIEYTVQQMMGSQAIYNEQLFHDFTELRSPEDWINTWSKWNCLFQSTDIELSFTSRAAS